MAVWRLTLRQFVALAERWKEQRRAADHRAGEVIAMLYNVNRDREKDPKGATWLDFFPEWKKRPEPQSDDEMLAAMMAWARVTAHVGA